MHGMVSLAVLVAALMGLAAWAGYVSFRLYRACPAARSSPAPHLAPEPGTALPLTEDQTAGDEDQSACPLT